MGGTWHPGHHRAAHRHPGYVLTLRIRADDHADVISYQAHLQDKREGADGDGLQCPLRLYELHRHTWATVVTRGRTWVGTLRVVECFSRTFDPGLAPASNPEPSRQSVGYVGASDGWADFTANGRMTFLCVSATDTAALSEIATDGLSARCIRLSRGRRRLAGGGRAHSTVRANVAGVHRPLAVFHQSARTSPGDPLLRGPVPLSDLCDGAAVDGGPYGGGRHCR